MAKTALTKTIVITLILWFFNQILSAQVTNISLITPRPLLYQKAEFNIALNADWSNPYQQEDIALDLIINAPSGKTLTLPCYYDSGLSGSVSLWKARFAPQEKGRYSYTTRLTKRGMVTRHYKTGYFTAYLSDEKGFLHVKNNWVLQFDNGEAFRGLGENIGWESRASDDSKFFKTLHENSRYNYEYMLRSLASHGGNFFRTWIAAFNLPVDWQTPVNTNRYSPTDQYYNPGAVEKMDRLVFLCDSLHLHMMLTLGQGASGIRAGGFSQTAADFFVNPKSKERYKDRLRYFIARWGYSPAIGAWELFNEVDNVQFANKNKPIIADSIVQWHDEMSRYIKKTDPYGHPVTTSISHRDLKGLNSLLAIDFNQKHIYKNTAGIPVAIEQYETKFGKPYVIGEYSYEWDWNKNFDDFAPEMDSDFKRGLWYGLFSPTPVLPMSWWWEYFDSRKTDTYLERIRVIMDDMLKAGHGDFRTISLQSTDTTVIKYAVRCGDKIYIYAFNPAATRRKSTIRLNLSGTDFKMESYDCESGVYKSLGHQRKTVAKKIIAGWPLAARTDIIFIINTPGNTSNK
jgi:hypothetical protein